MPGKISYGNSIFKLVRRRHYGNATTTQASYIHHVPCSPGTLSNHPRPSPQKKSGRISCIYRRKECCADDGRDRRFRSAVPLDRDIAKTLDDARGDTVAKTA